MISFDQPWWSVAALPWAVLAVWLARGGGRSAGVPFVWLWQGMVGRVGRPVVRRRVPVGVAMALLGMLVAVVGATGPRWRRVWGQPAVVVLDRGRTLSERTGEAFGGVVRQAVALVGDRSVTLVCVPPITGGGAVSGPGWAAVAAGAGQTAMDTAAALRATVADVLRNVDGRTPVLVLTDQPLGTADERVRRIEPVPMTACVGIVGLAARDRPVPAVMVRLRDGGGAASRVRVTSGGFTAGEAGVAGDAFITMPGPLGPTVEARVFPTLAVDGRAWLTAEGRRPRVRVQAGVPAVVRRVAAVFDRLEGGDGPTVVVAADRLAVDQAGVEIVNAADARGGPATVSAHPVTRDVLTWTGGGAAVPEGFTAVVRVGGRPAVAVRHGVSRQVWANPDTAVWSRTSDWVVFFANALRWVAGGPPTYAAVGPGRLGPDWSQLAGDPRPAGTAAGEWPGLYRSERGKVLAVNAGGPTGTAGAMPVKLGPVAVAAPAAATGWVGVTAVAGLVAAAVAWPGRDRR